ncbi:glycosyltransferase [Haladaptatus sp. DYSN1]|uniref:glycosyltransferase n=1 Tax=unclassified Haladaptatus TaxID=2622732 RepID=UPI002406CA50|nr:glycosyltransferase [Haladaptatus sp. DYSN1]
MSSKRTDTTSVTQSTDSRNRPAIGLIVTVDNTDAIVRVLLRATNEGYDAIVTHYGDSTIPAMQFARDLDAHVVHPEDIHPDTDTLRQGLARAARDLGYPGLLIHENPREFIDYETSIRKLSETDGYAIDTETNVFEAWARRCRTLVAIPAYNEETSIAHVVQSVSHHADCVLVVDDGSSDGTARRAKEAGAFVVTHEQNMGYGAAIKTAFKEARKRNAHHLVTIDADGQHDPADIPKLIHAIEINGADFVIGSRFAGEARDSIPMYRRFGLSVVNLMTNFSLGLFRARSRVSDTQSGFRAYNGRAIDALVENGAITDHMSASTDILYHVHKHGLAIEEVGTTISYDVENGSKHHPVSHGIVLVRNLLKTVERDHPISVLGIPGFLSAFVGIFFGYLAVMDFFRTQTFAQGFALTSAFFLLIGVLACFTAIILHSFNMHLPDRFSK